MSESTLDSKGRLLIPENVRKKVGMNPGSKVKVSVQDGAVTIRKSVAPEEFIRKTEGVIKKRSLVEQADPLKIKDIWEKKIR